jgi:hypothetical protein
VCTPPIIKSHQAGLVTFNSRESGVSNSDESEILTLMCDLGGCFFKLLKRIFFLKFLENQNPKIKELV